MNALNGWLNSNKAILETIGLIGALAGLIILIVQTNQVTRQTEALQEEINLSARQEVFSTSLESSKLALENPTLFEQISAAGGSAPALELSKILEQKPLPEAGYKAYQLANYYIDFYDFILSEYPVEDYPKLGESETKDEGYVAWSNAIKRVYTPGSLMCSQLIFNKVAYGDSYVSRIRDAQLCPGL